MNIILASKSPRRTEILSMMNIDHLVIPSKEKEVIDPSLTPTEVVMSLAYQKAKSVAVNYPNDLVIGADTIVVINNEILGKPRDYNDAVRMLSLLENNTHQVLGLEPYHTTQIIMLTFLLARSDIAFLSRMLRVWQQYPWEVCTYLS
jgi:MAF protein